MLTGERKGKHAFSYRYLCLQAAGLLMVGYVVVFAIATTDLPLNTAWWVGFFGGPVLIVCLGEAAITLGWKAVKGRLEGVLSYDGSDIETAKVRSFRGLLRWIAEQRRAHAD